jgi:hypothetical protein
VNLLILVVDDEPDVELLFRQQFRHDLRAGRWGSLPCRRQSCPLTNTRSTSGWSHFLRQPAKVDLPMQRTIHHADTETIFRRVQGQGCA